MSENAVATPVPPSPVPRVDRVMVEPLDAIDGATEDEFRTQLGLPRVESAVAPTVEPELTPPTADEIRRHRFALAVAALRSDEYTQTFGRLCHIDVNGFCRVCAMAVLIEVAIANGLTTVNRVDGPLGYASYVELNDPMTMSVDYTSSMPPAVCEWYGIDYDAWSGSLMVQGQPLDYWNDARRKTFPQIADMIEAEYVTVPVEATV